MAGLDLSFDFMGESPVRETEHWVSQLSPYNNQELRIIKSLDPVEPDRPELHLSCSVGKRGKVGSHRVADDKEFAALKEWAESKWGRKLQEETHPTQDKHVRHLWEIV